MKSVPCRVCSRPFPVLDRIFKDRQYRGLGFCCKPCLQVIMREKNTGKKRKPSRCSQCGSLNHTIAKCPDRGHQGERESSIKCLECLDLYHRLSPAKPCWRCGEAYRPEEVGIDYVLSLPRESRVW